MPTIYLSPSTQPHNLYATTGNEEYWMNLLADAMEPYLMGSGINFVRKTLDMSAQDAISASNEGVFDLHVALHSNAAPEQNAGKVRGIVVFYNAASTWGKTAAQMMVDELKKIYPFPNLVKIEPTTTVPIGEVDKVKAPAAFLELGYHDNVEDAIWISENIPSAAMAVSKALANYFGLPFGEVTMDRDALVNVSWGSLNIREYPSTTAPIIATAPKGTLLTVLREYDGWYVVKLGNILGFANGLYLQVL